MGLFGRNKNKPMEAFEAGQVVAMKDVDDPTFSQEILGPGIAIEPKEGALFAPCDGKITLVADTKHAVSLESPAGVEVLMHIGIDTVELKGEGFEVLVQTGDKVKAGDKLITFDMDLIKGKGYKLTTPLIICNHDEFGIIEPLAEGEIAIGDPILKVEK